MLETINRITIPIHEIKDHKWFTHQIENENQWKSLYSPYLLKTSQKIVKSMFYVSPTCGIQH
jgi:hypothetical protein